MCIMKKQEIDHILVRMLDYHRDVSDLNFTVGKPMQVERFLNNLSELVLKFSSIVHLQFVLDIN